MLCSHLPTDPFLAGKIPIRYKNVRFLSQGELSDLNYYKDKKCHLKYRSFSQKVACLKCFEKLKVMNYRPKVLESPTKNQACL